MSPEQKKLLRDLMHNTPVSYQKRLAMAHHLKTTGGNPNPSSRFGPLEQEAGKRLAETKYPMSPELEAQMKAGKFKPENLPKPSASNPVDPQASQPVDPAASEPVGGVETDEPLNPEQQESVNRAQNEGNENFPRSMPRTPSIKKLMTEPVEGVETNLPQTPEQDQMDAEASNLSRGNFPRSMPPDASARRNAPADFDASESLEGIETDEPQTTEQNQSDQLAFDEGRENFPRSMPLPIKKHQEKVGRTSRTTRIYLMVSLGALLFVTAWGMFAFVSPSYSGVVSGLKGTQSGIIVDLDGTYPNEKMTIWIPKKVYPEIQGRLPKIGSRIKVLGRTVEYHGRPEIIMEHISQLIMGQ